MVDLNEPTPTTWDSRDRPYEDPPAEVEASTDALEGQNFGAYIILRAIGSGGMGRVYLALDRRLTRHVAIKILHQKLASHARRGLRREGQSMARVVHPSVVTVFEV